MMRTHFIEFYIMTDSLPDWTGVVQAAAAIFGTVFAVITVWKLMARDKQREKEVESLISIASQLTSIMSHNENKFEDSKKPRFGYRHKFESGILTIVMTNKNPYSTIINFSIDNKDAYSNLLIEKTVINSHSDGQLIEFSIEAENEFPRFIILELDYQTEEKYTFIQDLTIFTIGDKPQLIPSPIINQKNMRKNQ